jgi:hypothetical protein
MVFLMRSRESIDDSNKKKSRKYIQQYNKDNFSMYNTWIIEFNNTHKMVLEYLEESIIDYYNIFKKNFFDWLNDDKNKFKFMFEIKKEFLAIAEDVLLHVLLRNQLKKTENCFVIGPFQKYLEFVSREDSDITLDLYDIDDINLYPDIEPSYHLLEENNNCAVIEEECYDKSYQDDKYYQSFFV